MKRYVKASEGMRDFEVEVKFGGYIGSESYYDVSAEDEDEAIENALKEAKSDLEVTDVEDLGDGDWDVTVQFNGFIGVENVYTETADDQDEAEELALEEAADDLEAEISEEYQ